MIEELLSTTPARAALLAVSAIGIFAAVVVTTRVNGLRTFSKMSSFDFAVTVATGSLMATVAATSASLLDGVVALAALYACQRGVAALRRRTGFGQRVDNAPMLLLRDGEFLERNLTATRVTRDDVIAKLREANCLRLGDCHAVVLETTGDISVLHGGDGVDPELLNNLRTAPAR